MGDGQTPRTVVQVSAMDRLDDMGTAALTCAVFIANGIAWAVFLGLPLVIWGNNGTVLIAAVLSIPVGCAFAGLFRLVGGPD